MGAGQQRTGPWIPTFPPKGKSTAIGWSSTAELEGAATARRFSSEASAHTPSRHRRCSHGGGRRLRGMKTHRDTERTDRIQHPFRLPPWRFVPTAATPSVLVRHHRLPRINQPPPPMPRAPKGLRAMSVGCLVDSTVTFALVMLSLLRSLPRFSHSLQMGDEFLKVIRPF